MKQFEYAYMQARAADIKDVAKRILNNLLGVVDGLEVLHHNAHHCHGNLGVLFQTEDGIHGTVFAEHIVDGSHCRHQTDLGQEAGNAQHQGSAADIALQPVVGLPGLDDLHVTKIAKAKAANVRAGVFAGRSAKPKKKRA